MTCYKSHAWHQQSGEEPGFFASRTCVFFYTIIHTCSLFTFHPVSQCFRANPMLSLSSSSCSFSYQTCLLEMCGSRIYPYPLSPHKDSLFALAPLPPPWNFYWPSVGVEGMDIFLNCTMPNANKKVSLAHILKENLPGG